MIERQSEWQRFHAEVMELADVTDSKSVGSDTVPVRPRLPAPRRSKVRFAPASFYACSGKGVLRPPPYSSSPGRDRCARSRSGAALRAAFFHCGENIGSDLPVRWAAPAAGAHTSRCEVRFLIAAAPASPPRRLSADAAQQDAPKTPPQGHRRSPFSPPPPRAEQPRFRPLCPVPEYPTGVGFCAALPAPAAFARLKSPPQIKSSRAAVRPPGSLEIDVTASAVFFCAVRPQKRHGPDAGSDGSRLRALHQLFAQADGRRAEDLSLIHI